MSGRCPAAHYYTMDMMKWFDFSAPQKLAPIKGRVLIAEPFLEDEYFRRAVVLLCDHNEEGTFGFVLNNYLDLPLTELVEALPEFRTRISIGGPVSRDSLYYLHTLGERFPGSIEIMPGLYMGGSYEAMKQALEAGEVKQGEIRFFVGYSGWKEQQLEAELAENAWVVTEAESSWLMDTEIENLWKKVLSDMGSHYSVFANYPEDPSLN